MELREAVVKLVIPGIGGGLTWPLEIVLPEENGFCRGMKTAEALK